MKSFMLHNAPANMDWLTTTTTTTTTCVTYSNYLAYILFPLVPIPIHIFLEIDQAFYGCLTAPERQFHIIRRQHFGSTIKKSPPKKIKKKGKTI